MYVMLIRSRFCCSGLVRGHNVAGVWVDAVLAVQAEGGDLDLEGGPIGSLELQVSPESGSSDMSIHSLRTRVQNLTHTYHMFPAGAFRLT